MITINHVLVLGIILVLLLILIIVKFKKTGYVNFDDDPRGKN